MNSDQKKKIQQLWSCMSINEKTGGQPQTFISKNTFTIQTLQGLGICNGLDFEIEEVLQIPGADFLKVLSSLSDQDFQIQQKDKILTIQQRRFSAKIPIITEVEEMPEIEISKDSIEIEITQELWQTILTATEFASKPGTTSMPELTTVYFGPGGIWGCNRASMYHTNKTVFETEILLPLSAIQGIEKLPNIPTKIFIDGTNIIWQMGEFELSLPGLNASYPIESLQQIFDNVDNTTKWKCKKDQFLAVMEKLGSFSEQVILTVARKTIIVKGNYSSKDVVAGEFIGDLPKSSFIVLTEELRRFIKMLSGEEIEWQIDPSGKFLIKNDSFECCTAVTIQEEK